MLLALRSRLLRDRGDLLRAAAEPLEAHSLSEADSATDEFDHDLALSQLSAEQDALYEVDEALSRIRNGTYGVCQETGGRIPAARLRAIPWTRFSREVEARLEQAGMVNRPRLGTLGSVRGEATGDLEAGEAEEEKPSAPPEEKSELLVPLPPELPGRSQRTLTKQRTKSR